MNRMRTWLAFATCFVLVLAGQAFAQQATGTVGGGSWKELVATVINTAGVVLVVQLIKYFLPILKAQYGWAIPIVATVVGPGVAYLQVMIAGWAGVEVDFTPITAALTGGMAVAVHRTAVDGNQAVVQMKARRRAIAAQRPPQT